MIERAVNLPTIGLIAGTRVALGIGLGLLVADRFTAEQRKACGWTLFAMGALTTIPLAWEVLNGGRLGEGDAGVDKLHRHSRLGNHA